MKRSTFAITLFCALLGACAHEGAVQPAAPAVEQASESRQPFITENADGTLTIQRETKDGKGLVIKPQVIVPNIPRPAEQPK